MKVLWIESDAVFRNTQAIKLHEFGYFVEVVRDLGEAVHISDQNECMVVVYDRSFENSIDIASVQLLFEKNIPVLTVLGDGIQECEALVRINGEHSLLRRPVSCDDFVQRLRQVLGREIPDRSGYRYGVNGLTLDESRFEAIDECGRVTSLTRSELRLLRIFLLYPNRVFSKQELKKMLSPDGLISRSNNIEVHIRNLRKKVGEYRIRTLWGRGYTIARPQVETRTDPSEISHLTKQTLSERG